MFGDKSASASLETQCPNCQAALHADTALLQRSKGWARCGECHFLFDAIAHIGIPTFSAAASETASPAAVPTTQPEPPKPTVVPPQTPMAAPEVWDDLRAAPPDGDAEVDRVFQRLSDGFESGGASDPPLDAPVADGLGAGTVGADTAGKRVPPMSASSSVPPAPTDETKELKRFLFRLLLIVLTVAALGQVLFYQRTEIKQRWPDEVDTLLRLCAPLGCVTEPSQQLSSLRILSSSVIRSPENDLELDIVIENRSDQPVATPQVVLVLSDQDEVAFAQRVFSANDWEGPIKALEPGQTYPVHFQWRVTDDEGRRMATYRSELRYAVAEP